jgi:putative tricarboxylic transport membrane protein
MTRDRVPGLVLAIAGAAAGLEATTFDVNFMTDPVGPKALPYLAALTLVVAGLHAAARPQSDTRWPSRQMLWKLAGATSAFLLYAVALAVLGFVLSTTLVVAALSHLYGASPRRGVPAAAMLSAALWLLFVRLLALPLPIGELWIR